MHELMVAFSTIKLAQAFFKKKFQKNSTKFYYRKAFVSASQLLIKSIAFVKLL